LDIEMSFIDQDDILELIEDLYTKIIEHLFPEKKIKTKPFPRLSYQEAIEKYKSDKPDLRSDKNNPNELAFCFVTDFPLFEWHKEEKRWGAMHHPFTKPKSENIEEIKKQPAEIISYQHDFVLNGWEIGGGSIRITDLQMLTAVFEVLGHSPEETREKFKNYFDSFKYGVPPHGGIAPGIDRFLSLVLQEPNIREVIAFPKTGDNRGLMMGTPAEVSKEQLKELHIKLDLDEKNGKKK
jgi:aspartyl-tRNA synthetase